MSITNIKKIPSSTEEKTSFSDDTADDISVVMRPDNYWEELFARYRNHNLIKTLTAILNFDMSIYYDILKQNSYQAEVVHSLLPQNVGSEWWVLNYDEDEEKVNVVEHWQADDILRDWMDYNSLPRILPSGDPIPSVTTFDSLFALMTQFNPYWLLEVAAYSLSGRDFSRIKPNDNYSYEATKSQITRIRHELSVLLARLQTKNKKFLVRRIKN